MTGRLLLYFVLILCFVLLCVNARTQEESYREFDGKKYQSLDETKEKLITECQVIYGLHGYDSLKVFLHERLSKFKAIPDTPMIFYTYDLLGSYSLNTGKYRNSIMYYNELLTIPGVDSGGVYNNLGIIMKYIGLTKEAVNMYEMAALIAQRNNDYEVLVALWINTVPIYLREEEYDKAEELINKAYSISIINNYKRGISDALYSMALLNKSKGLYEASLENLNASLENLSSSDILDSMAIHAQIGIVYCYLQKYDKALKILEDVNRNTLLLNNIHLVTSISPYLSNLYAQRKDYEEAYSVVRRYSEIMDSLDIHERVELVDEWGQLIQEEKDKVLLEQELYITQQENRIKARNLWIISIIFGSSVLAFVLFVSVRQYRNKITRLRHDQEIISLKARVKGEEKERNRIAIDLHNSIAGQLWAVKLEIESLKKSTPDIQEKRKLQSAFDQLQETAFEVRNIAHNLAPDFIIEQGLPNALESFCDRVRNNLDINVLFSVCGHIPRLDREIELLFFRVVQELVQNVIKHAGKVTDLIVQVGCQENILNLTVEDNGAGFDMEKTVRNMGLKSIGDKITALSGIFDVQSSADNGTTAYIEVDITEFKIIV